MERMHPSRTMTIAIDRNHGDVYAFASNPENLPRWSFVKAVSRRGQAWVAHTPDGDVSIRFVPPNSLGVLDHYVEVAPSVELLVPMRVIPNGSGSEVIFTLYRLESMTDESFERDARMVEQDLATLKQVLEAGGN